MIRVAKEQGDGIEYLVAQTSKLPFADATFDAATAFSAFHWFSDDVSVAEIRRVLKPGGIFVAVNKNDVAGFKIGYRAVLAKFIEGEMPNAKKDYSPETILIHAGFSDIEKHIFAVDEIYPFEEALAYLRSVSLWNLVPESRKQEAADAIRSYCESEAVDGGLKRAIEVVAVSGRN
jgi:SAM-dependent methyltransferase